MADFELIGIPISEEQCMGDSLPYLNSAFQVLSTQISDLEEVTFARFLPRTEFTGYVRTQGGDNILGPLGIGNNVPNAEAKLTFGKTVNSTDTGLPLIYSSSLDGYSTDLVINATSATSRIRLGVGSNTPADKVRISPNGVGINTGNQDAEGNGLLALEVRGTVGVKAAAGTGLGLVISQNNVSPITNPDRVEIKLDPGSPVATIGTNNFGTGAARALGLITSGIEKVRISVDGNVGIGTNSPTVRLHVAGNGLVTGNLEVAGELKVNGKVLSVGDVTAFYTPSDARLKTNVVPISGALEKVSAIGGYNFEWRTDVNIPARGKDVGVLAQEIETVLPEVVQTNPDNYKSVRYDKIIPLLIQAIKELSDEVNALKAAQSNP